MPDAVETIVGEVNNLIEPVLDELGFELVDTEYLSQHGRRVLRICLDKEGGITMDDCALVSREIGDLIDVKNVFDHEYVLEVSSPGLDRPLKKEKDFLRSIGKKVKVVMDISVMGHRQFIGFLREYRDGTLYLEVENDLVPLSLRNLKKANLIYEFEK